MDSPPTGIFNSFAKTCDFATLVLPKTEDEGDEHAKNHAFVDLLAACQPNKHNRWTIGSGDAITTVDVKTVLGVGDEIRCTTTTTSRVLTGVGITHQYERFFLIPQDQVGAATDALFARWNELESQCDATLFEDRDAFWEQHETEHDQMLSTMCSFPNLVFPHHQFLSNVQNWTEDEHPGYDVSSSNAINWILGLHQAIQCSELPEKITRLTIYSPKGQSFRACEFTLFFLKALTGDWKGEPPTANSALVVVFTPEGHVSTVLGTNSAYDGKIDKRSMMERGLKGDPGISVMELDPSMTEIHDGIHLVFRSFGKDFKVSKGEHVVSVAPLWRKFKYDSVKKEKKEKGTWVSSSDEEEQEE
jgi:hypothetical protein